LGEGGLEDGEVVDSRELEISRVSETTAVPTVHQLVIRYIHDNLNMFICTGKISTGCDVGDRKKNDHFFASCAKVSNGVMPVTKSA
jgi:hypothetical protein